MALQHTSFSKSFSPLRKVPGILSSASSENSRMKRSKRVAEHVRNISRCALRLSTRSIGVRTGDGRGEGPRKGCDATQHNAGGKAGSIFKCTDLVQICACLPYRVVAQDGHSFERTHHQDMSKFDHHRFSTNLNSAVPVVVSWFLCLSHQPHTRIGHWSTM